MWDWENNEIIILQTNLERKFVVCSTKNWKKNRTLHFIYGKAIYGKADHLNYACPYKTTNLKGVNMKWIVNIEHKNNECSSWLRCALWIVWFIYTMNKKLEHLSSITKKIRKSGRYQIFLWSWVSWVYTASFIFPASRIWTHITFTHMDSGGANTLAVVCLAPPMG